MSRSCWTCRFRSEGSCHQTSGYEVVVELWSAHNSCVTFTRHFVFVLAQDCVTFEMDFHRHIGFVEPCLVARAYRRSGIACSCRLIRLIRASSASILIVPNLCVLQMIS